MRGYRERWLGCVDEEWSSRLKEPILEVGEEVWEKRIGERVVE